MGIARIARGTIKVEDLITPIATATLTGVVAATGSTVSVKFGHHGTAYAGGVTWNGIAMTMRVRAVRAANYRVEHWTLDNVTGATGSVVIDVTASAPVVVVIAATEITGATTAPTDKTATGTGSSTTPATAATATTSQPNELLESVVLTGGPDTDTVGTWSNSFNAGQRIGSNNLVDDITLDEGYLVVGAAAAYTGAKTGITSRPWAALIVTFKESAAGHGGLTTLGVG